MDYFRTPLFGLVPCGTAGLAPPFSANGVVGAENCKRLVALANQYAGMKLTSAEATQAQNGELVLNELHSLSAFAECLRPQL
jgi:hypothetical protein